MKSASISVLVTVASLVCCMFVCERVQAQSTAQVVVKTETQIKGIPYVTFTIQMPYPGAPPSVYRIPGALSFNQTATVTGEHKVIFSTETPLRGELKLDWDASVSCRIWSSDRNGSTDRMFLGPFYTGAKNEVISFVLYAGQEKTIKSAVTPVNGNCSYTPTMTPGNDGSSSLFIGGTATTVARIRGDVLGDISFDIGHNSSDSATAYWRNQ